MRHYDKSQVQIKKKTKKKTEPPVKRFSLNERYRLRVNSIIQVFTFARSQDEVF
jgi:hypothetical protein